MKLPINYDSLNPRTRRAVRIKYEEFQDGLCWYCKRSLSGSPSAAVRDTVLDMRLFPVGFLTHPVHLHHDHATGLTIGAVHARCNGFLWQYHGQ